MKAAAKSSSSNRQEPAALSVAILGGGIAGLSCASHLLNSRSGRSVRITLFDTGRLRPGGRCASRLTGDEPADVKNCSSGSGPVEVRRGCDDQNEVNGESDGDSSDASEYGNIARILRQGATSTSPSRDRIIQMGPVDHAAQILSIPNNIMPSLTNADSSIDTTCCFQDQIQKWLEDGVIVPYPDSSVCELIANDKSAAVGDDGAATNAVLLPIQGDMYYGKGGMASIPLAMRDYCQSRGNNSQDNVNINGHSFQIHQDVWVSPSNGVKYIGNNNHHGNTNTAERNNDEPRWELRAGSKSLGKYQYLIIAHNGKCADRIMSKTPARNFHSLLRTKFAPSIPQWGGQEMTLNSIYSLVFAVKSQGSDGSVIASALKRLQPKNDHNDISPDVYTVMIRNEPNLRLLSSNSLKHHHVQNASSSANYEVYTLLSSATFGKRYKGPQENLPLDLMETVTIKMLQSLENALGMDEQGAIIDNVVDLKLQLWGAAVPLNTWTSTRKNSGVVDGFVYDAKYNVGACGDWILDSSIAGAWESGRRLAGWMTQTDGVSRHSVGLPSIFSDGNESGADSGGAGGKFVPSRAALESGIGTIPPTPNSGYEFPARSNDDGRLYKSPGRGGGESLGRSGGNRSRGGQGGGRNEGRNNNVGRGGRRSYSTGAGRSSSQTVAR
ncbi:hypothetical protein ACHAWO_000087 [Cyclotella atomus]|uniref:Protoporphyrinogen oxidase n=1 Tax=Cyclotella atomus TaxID=382360 RepID=A0ABD3P4L9_9STRA